MPSAKLVFGSNAPSGAPESVTVGRYGGRVKGAPGSSFNITCSDENGVVLYSGTWGNITPNVGASGVIIPPNCIMTTTNTGNTAYYIEEFGV